MAQAKLKPTTAIEYLDRPPSGWFVLDVMETRSGNTPDWVALMIDVAPDREWRHGGCTSHSVWVRIPGKHRNYETAWDALETMIATRH